jgi:C_GCAxxG_C_C family probable redox protein
MSDNADEAVKMFGEGFNCAQAILTSCGKGLPIDRDTALAVAGPFGGGMGSMGKTCGAVTGAMMVIGLRHPRLNPVDDLPKQAAIRLVRELVARFESVNGSIVCKDLLGCDLSTPEGVEQFKAQDLHHKVCPKLIRDAAEILDDILE